LGKGGPLAVFSSNKWLPLGFLLLLIFIAVGFFLPVSRSGLWGFLFKGLLFLFVLFLFYGIWSNTGKETAARDDEAVSDRSADKEQTDHDFEMGAQWKGFGEAFHWYSQEFLSMVRSALAATNAGLYLQREEDVLEFQVGESPHGKTDRKLVLKKGGLIHHVIKSGSRFINNELPGGTTLAGLGGLDIRSFMGVPLIWNEKMLGVLAVGSEAANNFSEEDATFLTHCGRLITQVMIVYHQGLRWERDQKLYRIHLDLIQSLETAEDEESAVACFVQHIKGLFQFDRFTLSIKEGDKGCIHYVFGQIDDLDRGTCFPLDEGINGWILKRNSPIVISNMEKGNYQRPRYFQNEGTDHGLHSFLGIPLGTSEHVWGCISLESREIGQYSESGKDILTINALLLQSALEKIRLNEQMESLAKNKLSSESAQFQIE
jgi:transcriptional regulator with GAF, ATPase, and Fis domain